MITVTADCQHFVPSVEQATITYQIPANKRIVLMGFKVTDRTGAEIYLAGWGSNHPTYPAPPANSQINWNGENNRSPAVLDPVTNAPITQYANPIGSPYRLLIRAKLAPAVPLRPSPNQFSSGRNPMVGSCGPPRTATTLQQQQPLEQDLVVDEGSCDISVFYRDIQLEVMPWLNVYKACTEKATGAYPAANNDRIMWLQYKLNELGYYAGPLIASNTRALSRALFQYTQSHTALTLPKIYGYTTLVAGPPGAGNWGWRAAWENVYGTINQIVGGGGPAPGVELLNKLQAGTGFRDIMRLGAWATRRRSGAMAIVDHDAFYINGEYASSDAHADYDKEFFNPAILPLRAKILLLSKADADATQPGIDAPPAVGPAEVEWLVFDPSDEMLSPQDDQIDLPAEFRPKARIYLTELLKARAGNAADPLNRQDNCPVDLGGVRATPCNMNSHFLGLENLTPPVARGQQFFATAHSIISHPRTQLGAAPAYFQGSYIAGDNYVIQARLSLDYVAGGSLRGPHTSLAGLANSFGPAAFLPAQQELAAVRQTGKLTIWRRTHVLREISWGPQTYPAAAWNEIAATYASAYILLIPPPEQPIRIEQLFLPPALDRLSARLATDGQAYFNPQPAGEAKAQFAARHGNPTFDPSGMYPLALPTLAEVETATHADNTRAPGLRYETYLAYLEAIFRVWPKYDPLAGFYQALRKEYDNLGRGPGLLILRARFGTTPDWNRILPADVLRATAKSRAVFEYPYRTLSTGGDYGIVCLDDCAMAKYTDPFVVTHEIGHCLFTTHPWEFQGDHDKTDTNCTMYYPDKNEGVYIGWALRDRNEFGLRIVLEGKKADGSLKTLPTFGKLDGSIEPEIVNDAPSKKRFYCRGGPDQIQKKLNGLKFTPAKNLDAELARIDIQITFDDSGRWVPKLSVGWVNKRPYVVRTTPNGGTVRPFDGITATPLSQPVPTFCGKCLLKLRGWRVREDAGHTGAANMIDQPRALPVLPRMQFLRYKIKEGQFVSSTDAFIDANDGSIDPLNRRMVIGPLAFLHVHQLSWESSDGNLASLAGISTREEVRFLTPTQAAPFCDFADPDQYFTQVGTTADQGLSTDDHSVMIPSLICANPRVPGILVGQQWYQYSLDGVNYQNIEGAAFLLEKEVWHDGKGWVLTFRKKNWAPHNATPFYFEASYRVGPTPVTQPKIVANSKIGTMAVPYRTAGATRFLSGANESMTHSSGERVVELSYLKKKGYHV